MMKENPNYVQNLSIIIFRKVSGIQKSLFHASAYKEKEDMTLLFFISPLYKLIFLLLALGSAG